MLSRLQFLVVIFIVVAAPAVAQSPNNGPRISRTADLLFLSPDQQRVYYKKVDSFLSTNLIKAGTKKYPLVTTPKDFSRFSFTFKDTARSLDEFMTQTNVVGLIIMKNDSILFEQYRHETDKETKWINFSVAKSVTSLLFGLALRDGYIKSLQANVSSFIPELKGSAYDSVSLHHLLQMSSGIKWSDDPRDPNSDLLRISSIERQHGWRVALDSIAALKRIAAPGKRFNYNTTETVLAAIILKRAIGKPLSEYFSEKVWQPFGMHSNANWVKVPGLDVENGGCCISSTLRDYALLGLFTLRNGVVLDGTQVLDPDWMQRSVAPASSYKGYGYYWWLHPNNKRYFASGAFGQQIEVDPEHGIVIAVQSYWPVPFGDYYLGYLDGFIEAMVNHLKNVH